MSRENIFKQVGEKIEQLAIEAKNLPYSTCLYRNENGDVFVVELHDVAGAYVGRPIGFPERNNECFTV